VQDFTEWLFASGLFSPDDHPLPHKRREEEPTEEEAEEAQAQAQGLALRRAEEVAQGLEQELEAAGRRLAEAEEALRRQRQEGEEREARIRSRSEAKLAEELQRSEAAFEAELETTLQFWRSIARSSACARLSQTLDLGTAELLGNGRYGYVFRGRRCDDGHPVVVKLLSIRWAHVAAKEWQQAQAVGAHPHLVEYTDVMLHADDDRIIAQLLQASQESGKLHVRNKRASFPDRFLCLMEEYMNRGTVQDWMDKELLLPGGLLAVMRSVAHALAFMHRSGITHNDVKPENIMLAQADESDPRSEVVVKLGDLGLAKASKDLGPDFEMYGLTVLCMVTGEKFGSRRFCASTMEAMVSEVAALTGERRRAPAAVAAAATPPPLEPALARSLAELPRLLRQVWSRDINMVEVADHARLQGWSFFDGAPPAPPPEQLQQQQPASLGDGVEEAEADEHDEWATPACSDPIAAHGSGVGPGPGPRPIEGACPGLVEVASLPLDQRSMNKERVLDLGALSARRAQDSARRTVAATEQPCLG